MRTRQERPYHDTKTCLMSRSCQLMIISFFGSLLETEELKRLVFGLWLRHTSLIVRNKRGFRRRFTHEFHVKNEPRQKQVWMSC